MPSSRAGGLGACTKHVKCRSVLRSVGTVLCPPDAASAWMLAKSGVVSRSFARSSGVLSITLDSQSSPEKGGEMLPGFYLDRGR